MEPCPRSGAFSACLFLSRTTQIWSTEVKSRHYGFGLQRVSKPVRQCSWVHSFPWKENYFPYRSIFYPEGFAIHWNSMWIKNSLMRNSGPRIMLIIDIDLGFLLREVGNLIWEINIQSGAVNNDGPCKGTWDIIVSPCFCSPVTESEKKWKGQSLSGVWLCNPMDCVTLHDHGILQARILEWVVTPFSKGSSQPRDRTQVSYIARDSLPSEPPGKPCHRCSD